MKGYISSRISTGSGIDDNGKPIFGEETWTDKIECLYTPNRRNTVGMMHGGKFRIASYLISVDTLDWNISDVSMIELYNANDKKIAEGEVLTLDELDDVQVIEITI